MTINITKEINLNKAKQKGKTYLQLLTGYVGTRVIKIGLEFDLISELADHEGITCEKLAHTLQLDHQYTQIWLDAAYSIELVEFVSDKERYKLSEYSELLLLDENFPGFIGGLFDVFTNKEMFDDFTKSIKSGRRKWWDDLSPEWIEGVAKTAIPMYLRLIQSGFDQIPESSKMLEKGVKVLELASGLGKGLVKLAKNYPKSVFTGLDGDAYSLDLAKEYTEEEGLTNRVDYIQSMFEDLSVEEEYDIIIINASMHECRDIETVTKNVYNALKQDGIFIISDLPFPTTDEEYKSLPGRLMTGINFFESQIDDVLLSTKTYVDLLKRHSFQSVGDFLLAPTQSVIYGYKK